MGLYRAVARPLFFSLPPEAAHRLAQSILSLPLPWERIGGAPEDPRLRTSLAGIELSNPVGLAAGFDKSCRHLHALGRLGFGYVVGGTITRDPRPGNAKPRIARYPRRGSMTNAMGLPNPGAEAAARILARSPRSGPRFASIADEGPDEVIADTVRIVGEVRAATGEALPINACGGVFSAADALACLDAGAATVQVYTGLIDGGPRAVGDIVRGLSEAPRGRSLAPAPPPGQDGTRPGGLRREFGATAGAGERRPGPTGGPRGRPA